MAHHLGCLRQTLPQHPGDSDQLFAGKPQIDENPCPRGGLAVRSQMDDRVWILRSRLTECALDGLQQLQVDSSFLADLPCRHTNTVVAYEPTRRQQHRRDLIPDPLDAEAFLE